MKLFGLTSDDLALLRNIVAWWRGSRIGDNSIDTTRDPQRSPELYAAKTPQGGIPRRYSLRPGRASCKIYRLSPIALGSQIADLEPILNPDGTRATKLVYNLATSDATAEFIRITRDKYGMWLVDCPCSEQSSLSSSSSGSPSSGSSSGLVERFVCERWLFRWKLAGQWFFRQQYGIWQRWW